MIKEIKVGTLVYDASPYKAPELLYGVGIVIGEASTSGYVEVHWVEWNITSFEHKINLEVVHEPRRPSTTQGRI